MSLEIYSQPVPSLQPSGTVPVELCLSFSFFFFLHFQGLKMRPREASLLLRRMGGVWTPVTRQPVLSTLCWSTNSTAATVEMGKRSKERVESWYTRMKLGKERVGWGCEEEKQAN